MKNNISLLTLVLPVLLLGTASRAQQTLSNEELEFFETKIRPVMVEACYKCHAADSEKVKGGLYLDSKAGLLKGGTSGPAIVPGNAERSLFIKAIRYSNPDLQMPPKTKLTDAQIADFEAWVKMGAPDPRTGKQGGILKTDSDREKAKQHWAFTPIKKPAVPQPKNIKLSKWAQTPIDSFILAKHDEKGLLPSMPADRWTLLRRATLDLTGLPPTAEEVDGFLKDDAPDAFAKVVDRLLQSPQYGERWGRYWLDVARYADTKGELNNNRMRDNRLIYSYTYRDYVINAFNEDLPYDQFIMQQIAADQLDLKDNRKALAGMGLLTLGRAGNNQQEVIDDRIDVLTRGFLGLSVYCARCHDHKFDPVPTKDYYSLYGVFQSSVEPGDRPVIESEEGTKELLAYRQQLAALENQLEAFRSGTINKYLVEAKAKTEDYLLEVYKAEKDETALRGRAEEQMFKDKTGLEAFVAQRWQGYLNGRKNRRNDPVFTHWVEFAKLTEKEFAAKAKELTAKLAENRQLNPLVVKAFTLPPASMKAVTERYARLFNEADKAWLALVSLHEKKAASNKSEAGPAPKALPDPAQEELRKVYYEGNAPVNISYDQLAGRDNNRIRNQENPIHNSIERLNLTHAGAPRKAMVLADSNNPRNARVLIKGAPNNPGDEVPRQFLEVLSGPDRKPFRKGSGRLELAQCIASKDNPLTARVIVNRVWMQHFGQGIVRSMNDFGLRADEPTHPELLDYLASWFIDNGWSVKKLHRFIMLSNTYQQSSDDNARGALIDPPNLYVWKMNRRRLDFESFRDSLLHISGKLDLTMGGPPVNIIGANDTLAGPRNRMTQDELLYKFEPYRRTVYAKIDRGNLATVFRTFDFANPDITTGQRFSSTVPQQALYLMNSPYVAELARTTVERTDMKKNMSDEERINALYRYTFARNPSPLEAKLGRYFLEKQSGVKTEVKDERVWKYGAGEYDEKTKRTKLFVEFPGFTPGPRAGVSGNWNGATQVDRFGPAKLDANGGTPGSTKQVAVIRRWTAPVDGNFNIEGQIGHNDRDRAADGVQAFVVSGRKGELGKWTVLNRQIDARVNSVEVKKGDTIDFIVHGNNKAGNDNFTWAPTIRLAENKAAMVTFGAGDAPMQMGGGNMAGGNMMANGQAPANVWSARTDFGGPNRAAAASKPLNTWEKYAQVLLLSNEIAFVD